MKYCHCDACAESTPEDTMPERGPSYTDRLVTLFTANPYKQFDGIGLSRIAGVYAWRTRVSDARHAIRIAGKGDILNTLVRQKGKPTISLYAFIPAASQLGVDAGRVEG